MEQSYWQNRIHQAGHWLSILSLLLGILVLFAWLLDLEFIYRPIPNLVAMNPATAFCFLTSGLALWFLHFAPENRLHLKAGITLAIITISVSCLKFFSLLSLVDFQIDAVLFPSKIENEVRTYVSNRMAPNTAFNFLLSGIAIVVSKIKFNLHKRICSYLALVVALVALFSVIGYLYQIEEFIGLLTYIPMAIHTAFGFIFLALAIIFVYPKEGFMSIVTSQDSAGTIARTLLPMALLIPLLLGFLRLYFQWRNPITVEMGVSLLILSLIIIFHLLVIYVSKIVDQKDHQQKKAEMGLAALNASLEKKVIERTRELSRSEGHFRALLEHSFDGIFLTNENAEVIYQSPSVERITGFGVGETKAGSGFFNIHPEDVEKAKKLFDQLKKHEGVPISFQLRFATKRREGRYIWVEGVASNWLNDPNINAYITNFSDVTQRVIYEKEILRLNQNLEKKVDHRTSELQIANKEMEDFTYSVSHDLRAPLRIIHGFGQMLMEDYGDKLEEEGQKTLKVIMRNTKKMGDLIDDMLDFSRVAKKELKSTEVNMNDLVSGIMEEWNPLEMTSHEIKVESLQIAKGDPNLLKQVWINLISNALKYSAKVKHPKVEIGMDSREHNTYFVRDNGVGFDMNYVHKLFSIFQRLHKQDEFEGTGVGLAIVQRIVARHGGTVWAEGAENEGATFYFKLPS